MFVAYSNIQIKGFDDLKECQYSNSNAKPNIDIGRGSVSYEKDTDEVEIIGC